MAPSLPPVYHANSHNRTSTSSCPASSGSGSSRGLSSATPSSLGNSYSTFACSNSSISSSSVFSGLTHSPSSSIGLHSGCLPHLLFTRGYSKTLKHSWQGINNLASKQAVQPFLPPPSAEELQERSRYSRAPILDTCIPDIPAVPKPYPFRRVGVITGPYSLQMQQAFAVVELAGTQFKVTADDVLFVGQLPGVDVNDVISLDRVMLMGTRRLTLIGRPYIPGAAVYAAVEEHFRDGKVHVFKKRAKKRYSKYQGPRPHLTTLRILEVRSPLAPHADDTPGLAVAAELMPAGGEEATALLLPAEEAALLRQGSDLPIRFL